jgi:hypothetical protein
MTSSCHFFDDVVMFFDDVTDLAAATGQAAAAEAAYAVVGLGRAFPGIEFLQYLNVDKQFGCLNLK